MIGLPPVVAVPSEKSGSPDAPNKANCYVAVYAGVLAAAEPDPPVNMFVRACMFV